MKSKLNKLDVASRQLDAAIELMFKGGDIVSVHTLGAASARIFADLLQHIEVESWRMKIASTFPGSEKQVLERMNEAQNFFKHADRDPNAILEFDEIQNDELLIIATLECAEYLRQRETKGRKLSFTSSLFQIWYLAKSPVSLELSKHEMGEQIVEYSSQLFPRLSVMPRFRQLEEGAKSLKRDLVEIRA
ncbi:MAG: hypothetical protein WD489_10755 [Rhodovibrionaceae bacterium]